METTPKTEAFQKLLDVMDALRQGCPWDRKQTFESLRKLTIEETYELSEAILDESPAEMQEELGDIIMHIVFYAKIAEEKNLFTIRDVIEGVCQKLIYRHPHIFSDVKVRDENDVKANWEVLKLKENGHKTILGGVPGSLPAMTKAYRVQEKTSAAGFDWKKKEDVWDKVREEVSELEDELKSGTQKDIEAEFGDVMFSLINMGRLYGIDPEAALEKTNRKFIARFNEVESSAMASGRTVQSLSLEEMDQLWEEAKKRLKN